METVHNLYQELLKLFDDILKEMTQEKIRFFIGIAWEQLYQLHFGLGLWIRNRYLRQGDPIYETLRSYGIEQKDDMSSLILQLLYLYCKENPVTSKI